MPSFNQTIHRYRPNTKNNKTTIDTKQIMHKLHILLLLTSTIMQFVHSLSRVWSLHTVADQHKAIVWIRFTVWSTNRGILAATSWTALSLHSYITGSVRNLGDWDVSFAACCPQHAVVAVGFPIRSTHWLVVEWTDHHVITLDAAGSPRWGASTWWRHIEWGKSSETMDSW